AEIAVMGADGAENIVFRREIDPAKPADRDGLRKKLVREYQVEFLNPYLAAERGYIDDVIDPAETRAKLAQALQLLETKREDRPARKHGNIPL
ncbi:MAG: methylmalonyl-CoA carboxyltransferase, partial [Thermoplasmata archaeon]|nr:methylmalonyl-CoA carboxyltransferase [Thermoplasmata archaeon]